MADVAGIVYSNLGYALPAAACLGVAAGIPVTDVEHRVYRALGLLFVLQGLDDLLALFVRHPFTFVHRVEIYVAIALPFAALNFAFLYHEDYGARPPRAYRSFLPLRLFLGTVALGLEVAYLARHSLFYPTGPLGFLAGSTLLELLYACIAA